MVLQEGKELKTGAMDPQTFILYTIVRFQLCSLTLNNARSVQPFCANAP